MTFSSYYEKFNIESELEYGIWYNLSLCFQAMVTHLGLRMNYGSSTWR